MTMNRTPITTLDIAHFTGNTHDIVLRDFLTMLEVMPEDVIGAADFEEIGIHDGKGDTYLGYMMDADTAEMLAGHYGDAAFDVVSEHLDALSELGCCCANCVDAVTAKRCDELVARFKAKVTPTT